MNILDFKKVLDHSWLPILVIILLISCLAIFLPEVTADPLSLQDTTQTDWFELEKTPTSWECDAPLTETSFKDRAGDDQISYFCNATRTPTEFTYDKPCLGEKWDFTNPLPKEEAFSKVGGFNHYRYCVNEIVLKNPTTDFLSSTDFAFKLTDMATGIQEIQFLIENPDDKDELIPWTIEHTKSWDAGLELTVYAYGEKKKPSDTIEWDFELTYKPENLTFYKDPFWNGATGDQSHVTLVPDEKYWVEDWESYSGGDLNPEPYENKTSGKEDSGWVVYDDGSGNNFINISGGGAGGDRQGLLGLKAGYMPSLGRNFTMYFKAQQAVDASADNWVGMQWYNPTLGFTHNYAYVLAPDQSAEEGFGTWVNSNGFYLLNTNDLPPQVWYYLAANFTMNSTDDGWAAWQAADDDGSGDWDLGFNSSVATGRYLTGPQAATGFIFIVDRNNPTYNNMVDNSFMATIPDYNMFDNETTNLSCPFLYSDAGNTPLKNYTTTFYKNGTVWQMLHNSNPSPTNRGWGINITSNNDEDMLVTCKSSVCDTGDECDDTPLSNEIFIVGTPPPNTGPTMDNVNISSYRGWNTSGENLFGGFNASDPDSDPLTNETFWYKDGTVDNDLDDLQEISSSNTSAGEVWTFSARVNDGTVWSDWKNSTGLTINTPPTQDAPILNASNIDNRSNRDLIVWNQTTADVDDNPIKNIVLWLKENNHYAHLYLPFEGGSLDGNSTGVPNATIDYSEHANNATVYNATWLPTGGYDGYGAYEFDGTNDFIDLNASTLNFNQTSGTIMAWFKFDDVASWSDGLTRNLFQFRGGSGNAVTLYKSNTDEMVWRYVADSVADETTLAVGSRTDTDWHHIAMTWSVADQEMKAYWDGVQTGSTQVILNNWTQDAETGKIGVRYSNDNNFNGTIDEVQSYHHALSSEQILAFATNITDTIVNQETLQGQIWKAEMTPNDGREDGTTTESNTVTVLNAIPTIPSMNITSTDPNNYTNGTLTGWHNYADGDGDAWITNSTKWFKDTVEQTGLQNTTIVSSALIDTGEVWIYSAAVQDNIGDWSIEYNATITINNAPPYQILTIPDITFPEDGYNDTINGNTYFFDLEGGTLGFEFYANTTNLNTTITNATGAFLFTAVNDWFGSATGYIVAVDDNVDKGNASNFTITVFDVNDQPTIPFITLLSSDDLNRTNGTITGNHGYADLENNTWAANSTKWYKDTIEQTSLYNETNVPNSTVLSGDIWIYSASVFDGNLWSIWKNSTPLTITDSNASMSIITLNNSLDYFDFEDIGFSFKVFDPDGGSVIVSLNITNNNVNFYTQLASILSGTTYSGNITQKNYNQTQVINISVQPINVGSELKNATTTIKSITVTAADSWYYGINETESGGYNLTITESSTYPYNINLSAIFYRGGITYTPTTLQYRTGGVTIFNVTIPMPLTEHNHTNISSRWEWNQSVYGDQSTTTQTSRNQTVDHGYFFTDWFPFPTLLLEGERFVARINYSTKVLASLSNASFEVITGLTFTASLNGTTQIYHNQIYTPLLGAANSTAFIVSATTNFTYEGITYQRNKNQSVTSYKMILGECARTWDEFNETSLYNISTHIYRMYNESNPTVNVTGSVKVTYDIFKDRDYEHRNFSFNLQDQWNHTVCIYPTWASFSADTVIQYSGTNAFVPRTYYHYGLSLNNATPQITNLYLIDDSIDSPINVYLTDQDDNPITNALVKLLRYYPEESLYRVVQVSESDSNGLALIKVELNDALYKLEMGKAGVFLDQTDKFPFINTDYYFRLNLLAGFLDSWRKVDGIGSYLTKNNDTGTFSFYWNDQQNILQTACLKVISRTAMRDTQLYYNCQNLSSGTINYAIDTSVEGWYIATSTIETNTNDTEYFFETAEIIIENVTGSIFKIFGLLIVIMLFMTLASVGFSHNPASAVVLGVFAIIMATVLGILHLYMASIIILILIAAVLIYFIRT